ncbi:peptidase inhibitor family I36 protein [Streptomyces sp. NPDC058001]|uniref:peptidase inhibitor family I36 protein n=1 Tax=Streptomyces sp. NPDC058001 TaxID=3346300 RepID=UPI0036EE9CF7
MRKRTFGMLAATAALAFTVSMAPPAAAEGNPPDCPKGYFCMYSGANQSGKLLKKVSGDWGGYVEGINSVFNNGNPCNGCDHVYFLHWPGIGNNYTRCFHFNPGPGQYKANISGAIGKGVKWGVNAPERASSGTGQSANR